MKLEIRQYTEEDYQYTHDLHRLNMISYVDKYWGGWNSDIFRKDVRPEITWIIETDGQKVGFFVLNFEEKAHLMNIQISPTYQGKGAGSQTISHCENESIKKGFDYMYLESFLDNPALHLYQRLGYKTYKVTESHYVLKKKLKNKSRTKFGA
jgi:ribosomal protein S18 acetylase RimI-like enzyme